MEVYYCFQKRELTQNTYVNLGKRGKKILPAVQVLSTFSSPCFFVKVVFNY